ncbi:MAG: hypothetical protein ABL962_06180 [Fimbriimonadaceae bacterium]
MQKKTLVATMVAVVMVGMALTAMTDNPQTTRERTGISRLSVANGNGYGQPVSDPNSRFMR